MPQLTQLTQLTQKTRFEVFKRDAFTCQYCGRHPPDVILHVDHITARANGGDNDMGNLITACSGCNHGKAATPLAAIPQPLADKALEVAEREKQIVGYNKILRRRRARLERESWTVARELERNPDLERYVTRDLQSIRAFLERMPLEEVLDSVRIANVKFASPSSAHFRYFCGVCWSKIKEAKGLDGAKALITP